ncbi:uncharacterized protein LOC143452265 [Clavelina lepadiformis]|uniref:Uncharacterized protein n=1 Tax=Clavelina lepadiformis TaxID=159417 RepID=A0ABP0GWH2_CLALP
MKLRFVLSCLLVASLFYASESHSSGRQRNTFPGRNRHYSTGHKRRGPGSQGKQYIDPASFSARYRSASNRRGRTRWNSREDYNPLFDPYNYMFIGSASPRLIHIFSNYLNRPRQLRNHSPLSRISGNLYEKMPMDTTYCRSTCNALCKAPTTCIQSCLKNCTQDQSPPVCKMTCFASDCLSVASLHCRICKRSCMKKNRCNDRRCFYSCSLFGPLNQTRCDLCMEKHCSQNDEEATEETEGVVLDDDNDENDSVTNEEENQEKTLPDDDDKVERNEDENKNERLTHSLEKNDESITDYGDTLSTFDKIYLLNRMQGGRKKNRYWRKKRPSAQRDAGSKHHANSYRHEN